MAHVQRLKLTLRDRRDGREWTGQPVEVTEDPDDHAALIKHLDAMARHLDHRTGDGWRSEYDVRVQGLDQEWRDFRVAGRD